MSLSLRRGVVAGCLSLAVLVPLIGPSSAGAATKSAPKSVVQSVLTSADGYLSHIRSYFLCSTAACKKGRVNLLVNARSSMKDLGALSTRASSARVQAKFSTPLKLFVTDVRLLKASYNEFFTTTSKVTLSGLVGNIFYLTSDVASDVNVLRAAEKGHVVTFSLWVEGEAATLVAMQTDAAALQSSSATISIGIYANQLLEAEAHALLAHAHGPNAAFNKLLDTFANNQLRISQSEILYLQGKKAPLTEAQVANLNVKVSKEFSTLITTETKLVKKK